METFFYFQLDFGKDNFLLHCLLKCIKKKTFRVITQHTHFDKLSCSCVKRSIQVCNIISEFLLLLIPLLVLLSSLLLLIICWLISLQLFFIKNVQQKIDISVYTGHESPRRLGHHLNLSLMLNSNHVSIGIKPFSSNIVFNKNPYNIKTNYTAEKMKLSIADFFSKCDQIRRKLRIWSH